MCFRPAAAEMVNKCRECGTECALDLTTCPECGAELPKIPGMGVGAPGAPGVPGAPAAPGSTSARASGKVVSRRRGGQGM